MAVKQIPIIRKLSKDFNHPQKKIKNPESLRKLWNKFIVDYFELRSDGEYDVKRVPTLTGFCVYVGISRTSMYKHYFSRPEYVELYELMKNVIEICIHDKTWNSTNSAWSIFLLKNHHGYVDKVEQKIEQTTDIKFEFGLGEEDED